MQSGLPTQLLSLKDKHGIALAEYLFYPDDELLYVRWHGHLTGAEVIRGVQQGAQWRDQLRYALILNDKSDTSGDWSEALPWLQYEWLPLALQAGVRALAYVFSPDRDNLFASQQFVTALRPHMAIEVFEDPKTAMAWLRTMQAESAPDLG
ncbi:MAG: hypothetical protein JWR44_1546 [Hymenobacter sp.]|jgi:hypothetical protein|nr:hypothetical protein [Hymenobacter sp.]